MDRRELSKRLIQIIIVLFGVSFLTFGLVYLSPGRSRGDHADRVRETCRHRKRWQRPGLTLGLDQPFLTQYTSWLKGVVTGDMGMSYSMKIPVVDKLVASFWPTLQLALASLIIMLVVSIPLGILSAVYQNRLPDYLVRGVTFLGVSIPSFWVGLILLSFFGVTLNWVSVSGGSTDFKSLILPAVTLAFSMSAKYTRQVRIAVLEELHQDYVTGARMRGIRERDILWKHVLPNAMLPLVTPAGSVSGQPAGRHRSSGDHI